MNLLVLTDYEVRFPFQNYGDNISLQYIYLLYTDLQRQGCPQLTVITVNFNFNS